LPPSDSGRAVASPPGEGPAFRPPAQPAYRCRHGYASAARPDPARHKNTYVREDKILPRLAALAILQAAGGHAQYGGNRGSAQSTAPAQAADLIDTLRAAGVTLIYDPVSRALRTDTEDAIAVSVAP
jgi:hypothetical protein